MAKDDHIQKHRRELAERGIEKTPEEVGEWFGDLTELFAAFDIDIPPDELVDAVEELKKSPPPLED